jgi:phospholipid-binding lipoprotein MlaA
VSVSILNTVLILATAQFGESNLSPVPPVVPMVVFPTDRGASIDEAPEPLPDEPDAWIPPIVATLSPLATTTRIPGSDQGDIVVTAQPHAPPGDPLQELNATTFEATQAVDRAVVRPLAMGYRAVVPKPIRSGFRNFLSNLTEPVIFLNFLLQLKPGKAAETVGRFAINSTIGAAGLFDMAKRRPFKLPYRPNGFAYTLGYYGVKPGPFLYLPLIGPTTMRDVFGLGLDRLAVPIAVGKPFNRPEYSLSTSALSSLDQRAQFDDKLRKLQEESDRPYAATREDYLKNRQAEIDALRGKNREVDVP